jgi:hypothetical protein
MLPLVRGLLGLEVDRNKRIVKLQPHLPVNWWIDPTLYMTASINKIYIGSDTLSLKMQKRLGIRSSKSTDGYALLLVNYYGQDSVHMVFSQELQPGFDYDSASTTISWGVSVPIEAEVIKGENDSHACVEVIVKGKENISQKSIQSSGIHNQRDDELLYQGHKQISVVGKTEINIFYKFSPFLILSQDSNEIGEQNHSPRIISFKSDSRNPKKLLLVVEGRCGSQCRDLMLPGSYLFLEMIQDIKGATIDKRNLSLVINFEPKSISEFVQKEIVITLK